MALQNTYSYNSFFDFYYQKCFTFSFISFLVQDILSQNVIDLSTQCKNNVCTAQGAWNRNCCGFCHIAGRQRHRHRSVSSSTSCVLWFFSLLCVRTTHVFELRAKLGESLFWCSTVLAYMLFDAHTSAWLWLLTSSPLPYNTPRSFGSFSNFIIRKVLLFHAVLICALCHAGVCVYRAAVKFNCHPGIVLCEL